MKYNLLCFVFYLFPIYTQANNTLVNDTIIDGKTIQEVVVTGKEITVTADKMIIRVNENVKKYSHDGYSALQLLSIPGLDVDPIDEYVRSHGIETLLCINGREASKDEIKTLNPKDIKRIEYYEQFNPEYPLAEGGVIDFIVKIRDNGGMVFAQANENLNHIKGNDLFDWRFYNKHSELGIQINGNYTHYTPSRGKDALTQMEFTDGDVEKSVVTNPSPIHSNGIKGQVSYIYRLKRGTLKFAGSLRNGHRAIKKNMSQKFSGITSDEVNATDFTHSDNLSPAFLIRYDQKFKNKASLKIGLTGDYTSTKNKREYHSLETYISSTKEKFTHLQPSLMATYPTSKNSTSFLAANYYYDKSTTDYWENNVYSLNKLINGQVHIIGGAQFRMIPNKVHFTLQLEDRIMTVDDGVDKHTDNFFTPSLFYTIKLPHGNSFNGKLGMGAYTPQMKYYSTTEKRIDEYQVISGNPDQKIDYSFETQMTFTSNHKWGMVEVFAAYQNNRRPLYEMVSCDNTRNVYLHTFLNGGRYERFLFNTVAQLNVIPKKLKVLGGMEYTYTRGHFASTEQNNVIYPFADITYMNKGFNGNLRFAGGRNIIMLNGYHEKVPVRIRLNLGYTINNFFFNLYANNPFMKTPKKTTFIQGGFSEMETAYSPRIDYNMIAMRVSYRFTYGKKHKFENVDIDDENRSAILDAGTK